MGEKPGMIAEISAGLSSAKALMDIAKGLNAMSTQAQINEVKIALQEKVIDIQAALAAANAAQTEASEKVRELEQEIVKLKDWEAEKQRYELKAVDTGAFAYAYKPGMDNGEPPHWLCANCFGKGHKSILQTNGQVTSGVGGRGSQAIWSCHSCRGSLVVFFRRNPGVLKEE